MGPDNFWSSGMWIFPLVMILIMIFIMPRMMGGGGFKPPWMQDSGGTQQDSASTDTGGTESPADIINTRYARGEISKEEYDQLKNDLLG